MAGNPLKPLLKFAFFSITLSTTVYLGLLCLCTLPRIQTNIFYLHRVTLTWFRDLNVPETFGFLHNQVTPFSIVTPDGETLHAWHVVPLEIYRRNQKELSAQPTGFSRDITSTLAFKLLRDDPDARLVLYLHGTAGTLASGWRPDAYRALYSGAPDKIHVLTFDYRGFGRSSGSPTENGLLIDAVAVTDWAINVAGIPASRIVVFGQSLGTAVGISLSRHLAAKPSPVTFAGMVLVASFSDVATLTATYRLGGVVPVLSPLAHFPPLLKYFQRFLINTWLSKDRIAEFVRLSEASALPYHVTFIHAEDDGDIPCLHTEVVYWHAVNAAVPTGISEDELEQEKAAKRTDLGPGGWVMEWRTKNGLLRQEMLKFGVHDKLMAYPVTTLAALRTFEAADPGFNER